MRRQNEPATFCSPLPRSLPYDERARASRRVPLSALAVVAASLTLVPSVAAADDGGGVVLPPASYTASACAGKTPIVVASDAAAQSDLYSAVTLAGVVGTDCVVLAGARGESWPADQRARLDAADADGYVVGGLAAVPAAKVAGLSLTRVAGADRWETARLVGNEARSLAGADDVDAAASVGAEDPTTDCTGDIPIVVASDAAAQSDLYSAVTLAGVIGTDCIVPAGDRDEAMPATQQSRLNAAAQGGYVVGGLAAVPSAKVAGRDMTRLAGADRWETAQFVGRLASGDTTVGTSTTDETGASDMPADETLGLDEDFTSVTVGSNFSCGLRTDRTIDCWGSDWWRQVTDVPSGEFVAIDAGGWHACGLRRDGRVVCWGYNTSDANRLWHDSNWSNRAPMGTFVSLSVGSTYSCGLRAGGTIDCWGDDDFVLKRGVRGHRVDPPDGTYVAVSAGDGFACGIRIGDGAVREGSVVCWGEHNAMLGVIDELPPAGRFSTVSAGYRFACGLRPDGQVECWGYDNYGEPVTDPIGQFVDIAASGSGACGVKKDGSIECWRDSVRHSRWAAVAARNSPLGTFIEVDSSGGHACALHESARIECWGLNDTYQSTARTRENPALGFQRLLATDGCGVRHDGTVACWQGSLFYPGWRLAAEIRDHGVSAIPGISDVENLNDVTYHSTSTGNRQLMVVHRSDKSVRLLAHEGEYWDEAGERHQYSALDVVLADSFVEIDGPCGLRTDGVVVCWNHLASIVQQWPGTFRDLGGVCGVQRNGAIVCPGVETETPYSSRGRYVDGIESPPAEIPSGAFLSVDSNVDRACGLRANGSVVCWGEWTYEAYSAREYPDGTWINREAKPPGGKFAKVAIGTGHGASRACGIRTNGTLVCWGDWGYWGGTTGDEWTQVEPPSGTFVDVTVSEDLWGCGVTSNTEVVCWGVSDRQGSGRPPEGHPPPVH